MRFFTTTLLLVSLLASARASTPEIADLMVDGDAIVPNAIDVHEYMKRNYPAVVPPTTVGYTAPQPSQPSYGQPQPPQYTQPQPPQYTQPQPPQYTQPQPPQHQYGGAPDGSNAVRSGVCDLPLWSGIRDDIMHNVFGNQCGDQARRATRLSFHDAGTYDRIAKTGGPNGSILKFLSEAGQPENGGLMPIIVSMRAVHDRWNARFPGKVSYADLAQLAGMLGTVICPGGPSVKFDVGRPDANHPDVSSNLPGVNQSVDDFITIFARMGLSVTDLVALIGAHTTGRRHDGPTPNLPFDTTINIWDTKFYSETLNPHVPAGTQRMPSDAKMALDPRTAPLFRKFVDDSKWDDAFEKAMRRMSNLGQHNLVHCPIIPPEIQLPGDTDQPQGQNNQRRQRRDYYVEEL